MLIWRWSTKHEELNPKSCVLQPLGVAWLELSIIFLPVSGLSHLGSWLALAGAGLGVLLVLLSTKPRSFLKTINAWNIQEWQKPYTSKRWCGWDRHPRKDTPKFSWCRNLARYQQRWGECEVHKVKNRSTNPPKSLLCFNRAVQQHLWSPVKNIIKKIYIERVLLEAGSDRRARFEAGKGILGAASRRGGQTPSSGGRE